jgi:chromosomal replication initiator protein
MVGDSAKTPKYWLRSGETVNCPPQFWDGVLRRLGNEIPAFTLDAWVRPLLVEQTEAGVRIDAPTPFHRDRVRARFLGPIARCLAEETGQRLPIELGIAKGLAAAPAARETVPEPDATPPEVRRAAPAAAQAERPALPSAPPPIAPPAAGASRPARAPLTYTFDNFVVGPCNALAREASLALAQQRQSGLNPLYLASAPGMGKTHLARAVVDEARHAGSAQPRYESAETFTNRFMNALRTKSTDAFKQRYRRQCDLLVVEDVQFLGSKQATQMELFHTLIHLVDAGVRVVLTGDRLPRDITGLEPRLRSQITAGIVAEIERPDASVRRNILRAKAASGGVGLPDECLDLLVEAVRGSVRDLEGALIQVVASASLLKRPIDVELTRNALHKLSPGIVQPRALDVDQVVDVVCRFFGVTRDALASRSRRRDVLVPRQLAMYLCRRYTDEPLAVIARVFDRDHPSVSNAVKMVERRILERAPLRYQVEELTARLDRLR